MTVGYELTKTVFFLIEIKFELIVFYLFIVFFIWKWLKEFFLPYTHCCIHIHLKKKWRICMGIDPSTSRMQGGRSTFTPTAKII